MREPAPQGAFLLVSLATAAIAFKGIFARFAYGEGARVVDLLVLRFAIALPLFWIGWALLRRPVEAPLGIRHLSGCALASLFFFLATLADFTAIERIGAGLSRVILFTFPVFVILLNALRQRERPEARQLLTFAVVYGGLWFTVVPDGPGALAANQLGGVAWALASAVGYAAFLVTGQAVMAGMGSALFTALYNSLVLGLVAIYALTFGGPGLVQPSLPVLAWGAAIAVGCTVLPFFLLFEGIRRIGAARASLISLSGPAITVGAAWWLLDERLAPLQWAGIAVVLVGVASLSGTPIAALLRRAGRARPPTGR